MAERKRCGFRSRAFSARAYSLGSAATAKAVPAASAIRISFRVLNASRLVLFYFPLIKKPAGAGFCYGGEKEIRTLEAVSRLFP